jgi:hypothetical protein
VNVLLDPRPLLPRQKMLTLDTDIPLNVAKLVKGKRGRKYDVPFSEACPCLVQAELDLQAL